MWACKQDHLFVQVRSFAELGNGSSLLQLLVSEPILQIEMASFQQTTPLVPFDEVSTSTTARDISDLLHAGFTCSCTHVWM